MLPTQDEPLDFVKVVDRDRLDVSVALLGKQRAGAEKLKSSS